MALHTAEDRGPRRPECCLCREVDAEGEAAGDTIRGALADLATAEKEAEATAASMPSITVADNTQWCLDYKLSLEVAGEERARNTLVSPFDPNAYHYSMNRGIYIDWVVKPLADAGCPIPRGYLAP